MQLRTTWKGSLNVSLVSLRVKAYSTASSDKEAVHLHQLHGSCQSRIRYQKVCPQHGVVASDQIVMGYEHAPQQHVVIDLAELDLLRSQQQLRALRIDTFIEEGLFSPLYFTDKHYYLLPDGPTAHLPYTLLVQAMGARRVQAVARGVLAKREQLLLLRVNSENLLLMTVLKYADQVRSAAIFAEQLPAAASPAAEERALAEALVDQQTCREFDLAAYQDEYTEKLLQLIEAKVNGRALTAATEHEPGQVLSLMEALRESVAQNDRATNDRTVSDRTATGRNSNGRLRKKVATTKKAGSRRRSSKKSA